MDRLDRFRTLDRDYTTEPVGKPFPEGRIAACPNCGRNGLKRVRPASNGRAEEVHEYIHKRWKLYGNTTEFTMCSSIQDTPKPLSK